MLRNFLLIYFEKSVRIRNREVNTMIIKGMQKVTLLDYPGRVACTLFTGGCNFRCPFCQNSELVLCPGEVDTIPN